MLMEDVIVLLKFVEKEFSESTLNGNLYFARNQYFVDLEEKQLNKGIGDKREGVRSEVIDPTEQQMFITLENGKSIPLNFKKGVFRETYDDLKKIPICCFVLLSINKDFLHNSNEGTITLKPHIEKKLIEQFEGRDLIYIHNFSEFIKRVDKICSEKNINRMRGLVKYYDDKTEHHPLSRDEFNEDPARALLFKRKFFEFQKEYRIALKEPQEEDVLLNIGDLSDIALNLGKVNPNEKLPLIYKYKHEE